MHGAEGQTVDVEGCTFQKGPHSTAPQTAILLGDQGGPVGFAELRRGVGSITDSVLSDRLSELAVGGLIDRTVTDTRPPGVTYALTPAGAALLPILHELAAWADQHLTPRCPGTE